MRRVIDSDDSHVQLYAKHRVVILPRIKSIPITMHWTSQTKHENFEHNEVCAHAGRMMKVQFWPHIRLFMNIHHQESYSSQRTERTTSMNCKKNEYIDNGCLVHSIKSLCVVVTLLMGEALSSIDLSSLDLVDQMLWNRDLPGERRTKIPSMSVKACQAPFTYCCHSEIPLTSW